AGHTVVQVHRFAVTQWKELVDLHPQQLTQRTGVTTRVYRVVGVDDAGEVGDHDRAPGTHVAGEFLCRGRGGQVQTGHHDHAVTTEIGLGWEHIDRAVGAPQPCVEGPEAFQVGVVTRGSPLQLHRPPRLPVPDQRGVGADRAATQFGQSTQFTTEVDHLAPHPAPSTVVRHHGRVELLGTEPGSTPLEEHRPVGAPGHVGKAVAAHFPGALGQVAWLPVDGAGGVLHEQPGSSARHAPGDVGGHGQLDVVVLLLCLQVVVVGHDVDLVGPGPVVDPLAIDDHEVGGDRRVRGMATNDVTLTSVALQVGVVAKAQEIRWGGRVDRGG